MNYEIIISRHGSPLYIVRAETLKGLIEEANDCVDNMKKQGEPIDSLEYVWERFPDEDTDDILMTSFDWEMRS